MTNTAYATLAALQNATAYSVERTSCATRRFGVVANFRNFSRDMGAYATETAANRRARDLNAAHAAR